MHDFSSRSGEFRTRRGKRRYDDEPTSVKRVRRRALVHVSADQRAQVLDSFFWLISGSSGRPVLTSRRIGCLSNSLCSSRVKRSMPCLLISKPRPVICPLPTPSELLFEVNGPGLCRASRHGVPPPARAKHSRCGEDGLPATTPTGSKLQFRRVLIDLSAGSSHRSVISLFGFPRQTRA